MKKLILLLCLTYSYCEAQLLNEKGMSHPSEISQFESMVLDDGSIFMAATASRNTFDSSQAIILKIDSNFDSHWAKRIKIYRNDDLYTATALSDGNLIFGGAVRQSFGSIDGGSVFKTDTAGSVLWHKVYSESSNDRTLKIFERKNSNLVIFIRYGVSNRPTKVLHTDSAGNIISQRAYSIGTYGFVADNVVTDSSENYYLSGRAWIPSISKHEFFICAVNHQSLLWFRSYSFGSSQPSHSSLNYTSDNCLIASGSYIDSVTNLRRVWLMKTDILGDVIYSKYFNPSVTSYGEGCYDMVSIEDGKLIGVGTQTTSSGADGIAFNIDSTGTPLWSYIYPRSNRTSYYLISQRPQGDFLVQGSSSDTMLLMNIKSNGESACLESNLNWTPINYPATSKNHSPISANPGVIVNTAVLDTSYLQISRHVWCSRKVRINRISHEETDIRIYPNPNNGIFTLQLEKGLIKSYGLFNSAMQKIESRRTNKKSMNLNFSMLDPGVYFLQINGESSQDIRKVMIY